MLNNQQDGETIRCIFFKEGDIWYGVALELHIVESGNDREVVQLNLNEAVRGYREAEKRVALPLPDTEYEEMWDTNTSGFINPTLIRSTITV